MMRKRNWVFWAVFAATSFLVLLSTGLYLIARSFRGVAMPVVPGSAVTVDLAHRYPEETLFDLSGPFIGSPTLTFRDLLLGIGRAKRDSRVEKLFLHVRGTSLGWAQAAELRSELVDFKAAGKSLVAFIEYGSNLDYYLASAANEIHIHPRTVLDIRGIRAEAFFLRGALGKLGVEAEFERVGKYKDAPDMFLRDDMSEDSREALTGLVSTVHEALVTALVEGRKIDRESAQSLLARGPFTAVEAKDLGLVDGLGYLDEVRKRMAPAEEELRSISVSDYRRATAQVPAFGADARIAVIYGVGTIVGGTSGDDAVFGRVMGSDTVAEAFQSAREDDSIRAVIFRIDSPGGSDVASDVIWRESMLTKEKKPVIVSMGDLAASGGYWIATASNAIVAEPTTITGSIGIYAGKFNLAGLYQKIGVATDGIETTPNADFFSSSRSFTAFERERLHEIIDAGYRAFLDRVALSRGKTTAEVDEVAQGRVWSGARARELGLVDELGGLRRALEIAKERAGIAADATVELRIYPVKRNFIEVLLSSFTEAPTSRAALALLRPEELLSRYPVLALLARGSSLALMPYQIRID
jgi:protease-4